MLAFLFAQLTQLPNPKAYTIAITHGIRPHWRFYSCLKELCYFWTDLADNGLSGRRVVRRFAAPCSAASDKSSQRTRAHAGSSL